MTWNVSSAYHMLLYICLYCLYTSWLISSWNKAFVIIGCIIRCESHSLDKFADIV